MADVTIYTTMFCPFCVRAKRLLAKKNVPFTEIDVGMDLSKRREMENRASGSHTVPQIFINGRHIGGSAELAALERAGELDAQLATA